MSEEKIDKLSFFISKFHRVSTVILALYSISAGIYKGITSSSINELISWIIIGFFGALIVVVTVLTTDFGLTIWGKLINWLINHIRKHPNLRLWLVFPGVFSLFIAAFLVLRYLETELTLRIFISAYLVLILPAAIISLVRDDLHKEHTRLSKEISRALQIQDPQAAIELAFTHFEDRLLSRFPKGSKLYGNKLIEAAYSGEQSKLIYSFEEKDHTEHLYKLMSGAYSIFRNPHHHRIVNDDEQKTQAIISLVELLTECVDMSEEREKSPNENSNLSINIM